MYPSLGKFNMDRDSPQAQSSRTGRRSSAYHSKKVGLAQLAKTHSLSNSAGNLTELGLSSAGRTAKLKVGVMQNCSCRPVECSLPSVQCSSAHPSVKTVGNCAVADCSVLKIDNSSTVSRARSVSFPVLNKDILISESLVLSGFIRNYDSENTIEKLVPNGKVTFSLSDNDDCINQSSKPIHISKSAGSLSLHKGNLFQNRLTVPGVVSHYQEGPQHYTRKERALRDAESTNKLNRHIGSIRRLLRSRGSSSSSLADGNKGSPVIRLTDHTNETIEQEGGSVKQYELAVPHTSALVRSSSLNMLADAFTTMHNLCVVPASTGAVIEESATARASRSVSPPLSASPGALSAASRGGPPARHSHSSHKANCGISHTPTTPTRSYHNRNHLHLKMWRSDAANVSAADKLSKAIVSCSVSLDEQSGLASVSSSNNEIPNMTGSRKLSSAKTKAALRRRKKNSIGVTLRKLKNNTESPACSSNCSNNVKLFRSASEPTGEDVVHASSTPSGALGLPPLAAKPDRCNCIQAASTPSLSRSTAFRDVIPTSPSMLQIAANNHPVGESLCTTTSYNNDVFYNSISNGNPNNFCKSFIFKNSNNTVECDPSSSVTELQSVSNCDTDCCSSNGAKVSFFDGMHSSFGSSSGHSRDSALFQSYLANSGNGDSLVCIRQPVTSSSTTTLDSYEYQVAMINKNVNGKNSKLFTSRSLKNSSRSPLSSKTHSLQGSPRHASGISPLLSKHYGSLRMLAQTNKGKDPHHNFSSARSRPREGRHNRKERIQRNKHAQQLLANKGKELIIKANSNKIISHNDDTSTEDSLNQLCSNEGSSSSTSSTPQRSDQSSSMSGQSAPARIPGCSVLRQELINKQLQPKASGLDVSGRPQSWCSNQGNSLPGVAAAIGTLMAGAGGSPSLLDSPCPSPAALSPSASQESLLNAGDDEEEVQATVAMLGAISTSEMRAGSYLYGGLDSLLGPYELDNSLQDRTVTIFVATWNMNGQEPPGFLDEYRLSDQLPEVPDLYVIGTQESGAERRAWEVRLQCCVGQNHVLLTSAVLGILHLNVFVRRDLIWFCSLPEESSHSLRPGTYFKTKGAIAISFQFFGTRFLFINSHLFAHEEKYAQRLQNIKNISHALDLPRSLPVKNKHKDITKRFDCVFWLGDMNFRLVANREHVLEKLQGGPLPSVVQHLLQWDQLTQARKKCETFLDYEEGEITFGPTFKFDPGTDNYDSSNKQRVPSYTDRILFKSPRSSICCLEYDSSTFFRTSDHKPVWGRYSCKIRPGKDDVPLNAGQFNREVYMEALKKRRKLRQQCQRKGGLPEVGCGLQ